MFQLKVSAPSAELASIAASAVQSRILTIGMPKLAVPKPPGPELDLLTSAWNGRKLEELTDLTPAPPLHPMERGQGEKACAIAVLTPRSPLSIGWRGGQGERLNARDAARTFAKMTNSRTYTSGAAPRRGECSPARWRQCALPSTPGADNPFQNLVFIRAIVIQTVPWPLAFILSYAHG